MGVDYEIYQDLANDLPENWRDFNEKFIPVYMKARPDKTKVAAGIACGALWTLAKGINEGDIVICPTGLGNYRLGEVMDGYKYAQDANLPHQRKVAWLPKILGKTALSEPLRRSMGAIGTMCEVTKHAPELEKLIAGNTAPVLISTDAAVEDPSSFALEEHLEEFLVKNWAGTEFGKDYDILEDEGEKVGQQYLTDTGPLDILAVSKDKRRLLVVELKKGKASDAVVGQTLRYMSYVAEAVATEGQTVLGAIVAHEDDPKIRRSLTMTPNISFYRYQVSFKLVKT